MEMVMGATPREQLCWILYHFKISEGKGSKIFLDSSGPIKDLNIMTHAFGQRITELDLKSY